MLHVTLDTIGQSKNMSSDIFDLSKLKLSITELMGRLLLALMVGSSWQQIPPLQKCSYTRF